MTDRRNSETRCNNEPRTPVDYALVIPDKAGKLKSCTPDPYEQIQGTITNGGVAELAEGGGLEKQNRRFAI
jgi:hypothetical protein